MKQPNLLEVVETQSVIISMQAGIINELFTQLSQFMAADELDALTVVTRINQSEELQDKDIKGPGNGTGEAVGAFFLF